ncbi:unnamed protein product [Ambrosiozyma monospora]|uniref:Unnamed protein product n=1 Tax=Ambrosiozyma monospora TaxID=43982 RepID=A0ACB5T7P1_AMBMO|nr:unnamed protein product [Ambrosiozyma monospora]
MTLLTGYSSDSDTSESESEIKQSSKQTKGTSQTLKQKEFQHTATTEHFNPAPNVSPTSTQLIEQDRQPVSVTSKNNREISIVSASIQHEYIDETKFRANKRSYATYGQVDRVSKAESRKIKKQRKQKQHDSASNNNDPFDIDKFQGPWAGYSSNEDDDEEDRSDAFAIGPDLEPIEAENTVNTENDENHKLNDDSDNSSILHISNTINFLTEFPKRLQSTIDKQRETGKHQECFAPKAKKHVYQGHRGGSMVRRN